jgi:hypothetical protein
MKVALPRVGAKGVGRFVLVEHQPGSKRRTLVS